ncbi:MAG TPA: histidine triad nucleotide-binding protein [Thermoleophilia bacterium]|nr:histidine triad nucleotide-binding protein [Thermoleophilia bacterium]
MDDCLFCRIANGAIPSDIVLEDEAFLAFRDIDPQAPQHVLVIPREHIPSLTDIDQWNHCEGQALLSFIARVGELLGVDQSGYRAVVNVGPDGGQEIQHLHFHVLGGEKLGGMR